MTKEARIYNGEKIISLTSGAGKTGHSQNPLCLFFLFVCLFFKFYIIVLVLPNIKMNPPQVYILNPPSSSLPIPSLWVVPVHQPQASSIVHRTWTGTNSILHRARTNNFTIFMEIQKTSNSQSDLEKEEWNWRNQPT